MTSYKNILRGAALSVITAACLFAPEANAQRLQSAYFDDNFMYRYQINPAFGNDSTSFVAMPGLGNLNVGTFGNVGLDGFIYNVNGRTTTFLNPGVDLQQFLRSVKNNNRIGASVNETVLAGGFKAFGGYNTVTIGVRADVGVYLPLDLLLLAKQGAENRSYDIGQTGGRAQAWAEVGFGHSHQINKKLRIGATLKVLVGGANIDARFHSANLILGQDSWTGEVNADLYSSVKGLTYKHDYNDRTDRHYVSGIDVDNTGINGYGAAIDLGVAYDYNENWQFSASLLDLGFIRWKNNILATTNGTQTVETDKYTFGIGHNKNDDWDRFRDDLSMLYQLTDAGDQGGRTTGLGATINVAVQYTLPAYRRLKFGFLNTTRILGDYSWTDCRLSANIEPLKWFSAGVNVSAGSFGVGFGWIANFKTTGFNFFIASDRTPGKLAKQGAPLNSNANVSLGINFPF